MVNLNMFSDSEKGKEKELRLDPPPLDDDGDYISMQDPIDVSDGDSDFGSGYSEVGWLEEEGPLSEEEEDPNAIGSNNNSSHLYTPSEPPAWSKGPVRFSLKPMIKTFSNPFSRSSEASSSRGSTGPQFSDMPCVVRAAQPNPRF
jgi:hypothetical protein